MTGAPAKEHLEGDPSRLHERLFEAVHRGLSVRQRRKNHPGTGSSPHSLVSSSCTIRSTGTEEAPKPEVYYYIYARDVYIPSETLGGERLEKQTSEGFD